MVQQSLSCTGLGALRVAPFSHARLSATLWNSLELYLLCCNDLWGVSAHQGLLLYWVVGTLAHLLAVLSFQIMYPGVQLSSFKLQSPGQGQSHSNFSKYIQHADRSA